MNSRAQISCRLDVSGKTLRWTFLLDFVLWLVLLANLCAVLISDPGISQAQVTTSITPTVGTGNLGTNVTQGGNLYNITGGTRPGGGPNLFHSFGNFSVGAGDIANFLNTPVGGVLPFTSNILGRVTGGNVSNIYGTIQTTGFGNANLFLMNPSGIVLGPNASLNVSGSVSFTSAQYIRLFDGVHSANFYANPANDGLANSILTIDPSAFAFLSAHPAAYGFLTPPDPNATITVQGSALSVPSDQSISLVGGKVVIQGAQLPDGSVQPAHLSAPNGRIQLASAASPGEFDVNTLASLPNVNHASFTSFASATLAPGSSIDVSGGHTVWIKGGQLVLSLNDATLNTSTNPAPPDTVSLGSGSTIVTSTSGADPGPDVQITVGNLNLDGKGTAVTTQTLGNGNGGNITANVGTLAFTNGAMITSNTSAFRLGQGGNVTIQGLQGPGSAADSVTLSNGAQIITETGGPSRGGDVRVTAGTVELDNASGIMSETLRGNGVGGDLVLNVGALTLQRGPLGPSLIQSQTFNFGTAGVGGNVTIQGTQGAGSAANSVTLSGGSQVQSTTLVAGAGGQISITAKSIAMDEAATINSASFGTDRGGDILVAVQQLNLSGGATITSSTNSADVSHAPAGNITVQGLGQTASLADSIMLSGHGTAVQSQAFGFGHLGDIAVSAKTLNLTDGAVISAGTKVDTGTAGSVTINAGSVGISGGSQITSQAFSKDSGNVTITSNKLTMNNGSIVTSTTSAGRGGDVVLEVGKVSLTNSASINSQAFGKGHAGDITIRAGQSIMMDSGSSIAASTAGPGQGGAITMASATINLSNSTISASTSGTGSGGSITIKAGTMGIGNGTNITSSSTGTKSGAGDAGSVTINTSGIFASNASRVSTSAENAKGGDIVINAQNIELSNGTSISAQSNAPLLPEGGGDAGNITITSASTVIMQNSSMTTEASHASGGQITIHAPEMVQLTNSKITTSVAGSATDTFGGNISIDPNFVILQGSEILAQAFAGTGGNITITSNVFLADPQSLVDASSQLGINGVVDIRSPVSNVSGIVGRMPESVLAAQALLRAACAARLAESHVSTFVERGRDSIPTGPDGLLATPHVPPSTEPSSRVSILPLDSGQEAEGESLRNSGVQIRPLFGPDLTPRVQLLSGDISCGS